MWRELALGVVLDRTSSMEYSVRVQLVVSRGPCILNLTGVIATMYTIMIGAMLLH